MNKAKLLCCFAILICAISSAQLQESFEVRYSQTYGGNMAMIANNTLSLNATQAYNGDLDNSDFDDTVYVDIDNDSTTFNSSSANFKNPEVSAPCIAVLKAFLYWSAADKAQNGMDNQPNWNFFDIKLKLPGEASYSEVRADEVIFRGRDTNFSNEPYVCFKDITEQVNALTNPYGTYQIANVESKIGSLQGQSPNSLIGTSGGWQIVFIYRSPELPTRNITLYDGYAHVTRDNNDYDINFDGFQTPPNDRVNADILVGALEGDRNLEGDRLRIKDVSGAFVDLDLPGVRPDINFFNSRITIPQPGDDNFIDRTPASTNTLGFDAALFRLNNRDNGVIGNNQTSATIRLTSTQETYGLYLLGLSVEVRQPNLYPTITRTIADDPVDPGTIVGVEFNVINTGFDAAVNVSFKSQLPDQVTLANPPVLPAGITYQYDETTNILEFNVEDGIFDLGNALSTINIELQVKDECYFIEENGDLEIKLKFETLYNGTVNPDDPKIASSSIDPNTCLESPFIINVVKPELAWLTTTGNLDRVLDCGDALGLEEAQNLAPILNKCDPLQIPLNKVSGVLIPNSSCADAGTYINTWAYVTPTGRVSEYVQKIIVDDVLGVEDNELKDFEYSINSNKIITLSSQDFFKEFKVFNLLGQETLAKTLHSNKEQINLSGLDTGIYIVLINGENGEQKNIKIILR